ncbi:MAG: M20/M25/M40 family metallo-hydrolase [Candidatus Bathyarchaeia archaeon]
MQSPEEQVHLLHRMLEFYSPSGKEHEISYFLLGEMKRLGLRSYIDDVGNVIGEYGNSGPFFFLCGHMDTVPGELPVRIEGNRIYGRGAVDAKPALAALICASESLISQGFKGKLLVAGVVDEEGQGRGIKNLVKKGFNPDYAIFGEPSGVENITIAYKGSLHIKLSVKTKTGHSSAPWLYRNAIDEAINVWRRLQSIHFPEEKQESKFYAVTDTLTEICGGGSSSTVPSWCDIKIDFRLPPPITPSRMLNEIVNTINSYRVAHPDVDLCLSVEDQCEPYEADSRSILVRGLSWGIREVRKRQATLTRKTGTGDMNVLGAFMKIPMVTYGAGDSKLDHTLDESIDVGEYLDSIKILEKGLLRTFELHLRTRGNT